MLVNYLLENIFLKIKVDPGDVLMRKFLVICSKDFRRAEMELPC